MTLICTGTSTFSLSNDIFELSRLSKIKQTPRSGKLGKALWVQFKISHHFLKDVIFLRWLRRAKD
jgi:hypothetical protein